MVKVVASVVSSSAILIGGIKWLVSIFNSVSEANKKLELFSTNHFPHLSATLDAHTEALQGIKLDVGILGTRMENHETRLNDTREGLKAVHTTLIKHLEDAGKKRKK